MSGSSTWEGMADQLHEKAFEIISTSKFYRTSIFNVGSTNIPHLSAVQLVAQCFVRLYSSVVEEGSVDWGIHFTDCFRRGLEKEVRERDWKCAEAYYLDCWKNLLAVEPPKRSSNSCMFSAVGMYDWLCMCMGTRLVCLYQHDALDFRKGLAVLAWIQRRQILELQERPDEVWQLKRWWAELEQHKALLLYQWSWAEELAGNLQDALRLQTLAFKTMQGALQNPSPTRVLLCGSLAKIIADDPDRLCEARLLRQTMLQYWEQDRVKYSENWGRVVNRGISGSAIKKRRWVECSINNKLFCVSPSLMRPRFRLAVPDDVGLFYMNACHLAPRLSRMVVQQSAGSRDARIDNLVEAQLAVQQEQWDVAVSKYLSSKDSIMQQIGSGHYAVLQLYRQTLILIGTQLAYLYQWCLCDYQECINNLEWLLSIMEPDEVSPQLLIHRAQAAYQCQRARGEDGHEAVEQLEKVMALAAEPVPKLSAILCLGLAESCAEIDPSKAQEWLEEGFQESHCWHPEWQICLGFQRVNICSRMMDFAVVQEHSLKLISQLGKIEPSELESNIHGFLLWNCYRMALDASFVMDDHGKDVGLQWQVDPGYTFETKSLFAKLMQLMEELKKHSQVQSDVDRGSYVQESIMLTRAGAWREGYAVCRCIADALHRDTRFKLGHSELWQDQKLLYEQALTCILKEIAFAEAMLVERTDDPAGCHWLLGLSYTRLGNLLTEQVRFNHPNGCVLLVSKLDSLQCTWEDARGHLEKVPSDYHLDKSLMALLGFSHRSHSTHGDLNDNKFCVLSNIAKILAWKLLQPSELDVEIKDVHAFLNAVAKAEEYSRLPTQSVMDELDAHYAQDLSIFTEDADTFLLEGQKCGTKVATFYDGLLIKIIERREQRANTQSTWSEVLKMRSLIFQYLYKHDHPGMEILLAHCKDYIHLYHEDPDREKFPYANNKASMLMHAFYIDSLSWLEHGLSYIYSYQWLRFYEHQKPPYYSQVSESWWRNSASSMQDRVHVWRIMWECREFCTGQTPPIFLVYYQLSKEGLNIYLMRDKGRMTNFLRPIPDGVDVEMEVRNFYTMKEDNPVESLRRLYKIFITPILTYLTDAHKMVFIAEQILASIPFAILVNPQTGKYLFQEYTVSVAPSMLALWHCIKRYTSTSSERKAEPMVIADPAYAKSSGFRRLEKSAEEIESVRRIFNKSTCSCNLRVIERKGVEANVKAVLDAAESPGGIRPFIHFAVHAGMEQRIIPHSDQPSRLLKYGGIKQGAIYLADPKVKDWPPAAASGTGKRPEGPLTDRRESMEVDIDELSDDYEDAYEETRSGGKASRRKKIKRSNPSAWQLRADDDILGRGKVWNVDMVVLSACNSSSGQVLQSGSYLNLPRALTLAGVPCVIAAQWKVEDAGPTLRLMEYFYQNMKDGLDASIALQNSMQSMLAAGEYSVYQWGAFMVWGLPTVKLQCHY